jgi:hypothetical protein
MRTVHSLDVSKVKVPRIVVAGLGAALQAADAVVELGAEAVNAAATGAHSVVRHGDQRLRALAEGTADRLGRAADSAFNSAVDGAAAWTEKQIVRRVAESMKPYLIDELVPEVIDGVMPMIRADVVPVVIEDLASDDRIRAMIAQQSRGMLTWSVAEVRRASAEADDRVETVARRLLGRRGSRE